MQQRDIAQCVTPVIVIFQVDVVNRAIAGCSQKQLVIWIETGSPVYSWSPRHLNSIFYPR